MGCGSSADAKPHAHEAPAKHAVSDKQADHEVSPGSAMAVFSFGDNTGEAASGTAESNLGDAQRRRTTLRRRGVSQEVMVEPSRADYPFYEKSPEQLEAAQACIKGNPLFSSLLQADLEQVVGAMAVEEFASGIEILAQNQASTGKYYVIQDGTVEIIKDGQVVATFAKGQGFGELELMYSPICEATVKTTTATTCLTIDRSTYRAIVMLTAQNRQDAYTELLKKVSFLKSFTSAQFRTLSDVLVRREYAAGEKIIAGGQEGEYMHIIFSGTVKVMGIGENGLKEVARFSEGDTVGELEFIHSHKCVADVVADTAVVTLQLHREHFELTMGPLKGFLEEKAATGEQYEYYNKVSENVDDAAAQFDGFCFGDDADPATPSTPTDTAPTDAVALKMRKRSLETKRQGIFAENPTEQDSDKELPPAIPKSADERELIMSIISDHALFKDIHAEAREVLVDVMENVEHKASSTILRQGDTGDQLYIITSGDARVEVDGVEVCMKSKGETIGELELMYDQPCRASVLASSDLTTYRLDRATYKYVVMKGVTERRKQLTALLEGIDIFTKLEPDRLMMVVDALSEYTFKKGEKLLSQGETPDWMYIILGGTVQVIGKDAQGASVDICQFERGSIVGQLEFLNKHATVADVVAVTDEVLTGRLHRDHFERVLGSIADLLHSCQDEKEFSYYRNQLDTFQFGDCLSPSSAINAQSTDEPGEIKPPGLVKAHRQAVSAEADGDDDDGDFQPTVIEKNETQRNTITEVLQKNILFSALRGNPEKTRVVVDAMERMEYPKDTNILTQDEVGGEHWFIIEQGEVGVVKGGTEVCRFSAGEDFGEMELMYACRTAASVVVVSEEAVCWRLDRKTYRNIILKASQEKRELCKKAMENVPFLSSMTTWQQDHLADALTPCSFKAGFRILARESCPDCIHIIVGGTCRVVGEDDTDICRLEYGELIGDLEFLNQHNAVADVYAVDDLQTLCLSREHFEICLGPVKTFLQENSLTDKYKYYRVCNHAPSALCVVATPPPHP